MDNKTYLAESAKTDDHGNFNFSDATRVELINLLRRFLTTMEPLDQVKRRIFYVSETPEDLVDTSRDFTHGILGVITEVQELAEVYLDHLENGTELDETNLREESGDLLWYIACILRGADSNFDAAMAGNIAKLEARFPEKFSNAKATGKRDKKKEMQAMKDAEDDAV